MVEKNSFSIYTSLSVVGTYGTLNSFAEKLTEPKKTPLYKSENLTADYFSKNINSILIIESVFHKTEKFFCVKASHPLFPYHSSKSFSIITKN